MTPERPQKRPMTTSSAGPADAAAPHVPVRMCVICRERFAKAALTRYVKDEHGNLSIDASMTSPGRGWYVCDKPECARRFASYRPAARRKGGKNA